MIHVSSTRDKGNEFFDMGTRHVTVGDALVTLLFMELAFGGRLVVRESTPDFLVVKTRVFDCLDTTRFSADTKDEMAVLYLACHGYVVLSKELQEVEINAVLKNTNGSPLLLTAGDGLLECLTGCPKSAAVMVALLLGEKNKADQTKGSALLKYINKAEPKDIGVLYDLHAEGCDIFELVPCAAD